KQLRRVKLGGATIRYFYDVLSRPCSVVPTDFADGECCATTDSSLQARRVSEGRVTAPTLVQHNRARPCEESAAYATRRGRFGVDLLSGDVGDCICDWSCAKKRIMGKVPTSWKEVDISEALAACMTNSRA
ncbi:hypothetical protein FOZ63_016579, partial [Perkinsus olseni]